MLEKYRKRIIKKSFRISNQNSIKVEIVLKYLIVKIKIVPH